MIRVIFLVLFYIGSLSADFFVVDGGQVVEIVNDPRSGADIIGTNGKLLKKYKSLSVAKRVAKRYKSKKRYSKKRKITKKKIYKKKRVAKKRTYKKKRVTKKYKKKVAKKKYKNKRKVYKKKRIVKKKTVKKKRVAKKRTYKKKYTKKKSVVKKKKKKKKDYIIIKTHERKLYHYLDDKLNKIYNIAVGKKESQHFGTYWVSKKKKWPDWIPTKNIKEEFPNLPDVVKGGKYNPLGARALYLGRSAYRIHGTNKPKSIGTAASHGCFRMHNKDVITLYNKTRVGTKVYIR